MRPKIFLSAFFLAFVCDVRAYSPAKIFCLWESWGEWCLTSSEEIQPGRTTLKFVRSRNSIVPSDVRCQGGNEEFKEVTRIDGCWSDWSEWSITTDRVERKHGRELIYTRTRQCDNPPPSHGGRDCDGSRDEAKREPRRFKDREKIDGCWSEWSSWSEKSVRETEHGREITEVRSRHCDNPPPLNGGKKCEGINFEKRSEGGGSGHWSEWSAWSILSEVNNKYGKIEVTYIRTRKCDNPPPSYGGKFCEGPNNETKCEQSVDGHWSEWSLWSKSSESNNNYGKTEVTYVRTRKCDNPPPSYGGKFCEGQNNETKSEQRIEGQWSEWSAWSKLSEVNNIYGETEVICIRIRKCDNPPPSNGGKFCGGPNNETKSGHRIDGSWSDWSEWSKSNDESSDYGAREITYSRTRKCDNPPPSYGGKICGGSSSESKQGQLVTGGKWCDWSSWSEVKYLHRGAFTRERKCACPSPPHGSPTCTGRSQEYKDDLIATPRSVKYDGVWSQWSKWTLVVEGMDTDESRCEDDIIPGGTFEPPDRALEDVKSYEVTFIRSRKCNNPVHIDKESHCVGKCRETKREKRLKAKWCHWEAWSVIDEDPSVERGIKGRSVSLFRTRVCDCKTHPCAQYREIQKKQ